MTNDEILTLAQGYTFEQLDPNFIVAVEYPEQILAFSRELINLAVAAELAKAAFETIPK